MLSIKFLKGFFMSFILLLSLQQVQAARPGLSQISTEKNYLRIENSELYEKTDIKVTSLGLIGFDKNMEGSLDLNFFESAQHGNAITLNGGAGFGFKWHVSAYAGLGISLGYNLDTEDFITAYYPDVGIIVDITKSFGISLSGRRYFKLYDGLDSEDVIMLGFVFR